jgi:antitoxin component YwqK of YwqJK toxin-antitoxin module
MTNKDGGLDGKKTQWDEKGRKQSEGTYQNGNFVEGKVF